MDVSMNRINVVKNDVYTQAYPVFDLCMKSNQGNQVSADGG
jgi:hypothetical protein